MADECRFDLQLEFVLLIIRLCLVVLQTRSVRDKVILSDCKSTFWIAHHEIVIAQKRNVKRNILREEEESVIRQAQKGATCQNYFQHMVKLLESDHLLLQIDLRAQVIALQINIIKVRILIQKHLLTKQA